MSEATASEGLACVAVYERTVRASLERIFENVLDWEHLPWLHRGAFLGVRLVRCDRNGWTAEVRVPPAERPGALTIEVRLERERPGYVARTAAGAGAGAEIRTALAPRGARETAIRVEFWLPGVPASAAPAIGAGYVALYTRLWDEDEAMMQRRQALLDGELGAPRGRGEGAAPRRSLGDAAALRAALPRTIDVDGRRLRVVECEGRLLAHTVVCPHLGGPLEEAPVEDGCVTCPWHGYRFDLRRATSADGRGLELDVRCVEIDPATGEAFLAEPAP